jgi:2-polyprenyl-3-methyl-5-hydroxy-6-metoxy-1,4-benzoquinol methylase
MNDEIDQWLHRVYEADGDREKLDNLYDDWATAYDKHIWSSGNPYIAVATGMTGRHVPNFDATILDAGCGTGNMAKVLHQMGYSNLDGLDPSPGMLDEARRKNIYQNLHQLVLDAKVSLPDHSYDAVVAAGVLTHGHAPAQSLEGIVRLVKPGGIIIFSLSKIAHDDFGFGDKMIELQDAGAWQSVERSQLFQTYPFSAAESHLRHWVCVYRTC